MWVSSIQRHIVLTWRSLYKFWCRRRAERLTRKNLNYACLSQAIVEGGFIMAWVVRLSVIPTWVVYVLRVMALTGWGRHISTVSRVFLRYFAVLT
jgi:hypothetical protein